MRREFIHDRVNIHLGSHERPTGIGLAGFERATWYDG